SALYNNLAVLCPPARPPAFGTVHGTSLSLLGNEGPPRQLQARGGGSALSTPLLTQAAWCELPSRVLLVLTSQRGVQMYESDGSTMVFWHALHVPEHPAAHSVFARGIAAAGGRFVCVGTSSGAVLVFDIPPKGTNVTLSEILEQHRDPITDIAAEQGQAPDGAGDLVTADDSGTLCLWSTGEEFTLLGKIPGSGCTCSSVRLWNGIVAAGYGNGQIRLWEAGSGQIRAQVSAHARWIYALDLAPLTGKLLSGAEDSFVHVWQLRRDPDTDGIEVSPGLGHGPGTRSHGCSPSRGLGAAPAPPPPGSSHGSRRLRDPPVASHPSRRAAWLGTDPAQTGGSRGTCATCCSGRESPGPGPASRDATPAGRGYREGEKGGGKPGETRGPGGSCIPTLRRTPNPGGTLQSHGHWPDV
ncbi:PREDICTED: WD repeat-containing protein 54, partial [Corvus brachyrhynchos]